MKQMTNPGDASTSQSHAVFTPSADSDEKSVSKEGQDPYRFSWSLTCWLVLMATGALIVAYSTGLFSLVGPPLLESYPTSTNRLAIPEPFDEYVEKFQKVYESPQEREERKAIFYTNLDTIQEHNFYKEKHQNPYQNNTEKGFTYTMGINQWMDRRLPEELPLGLRKKKKSGSTHPWEESALIASKRTASQDFYQHWLETTVVSVADLPTEVDWRTHQPSVVTPVKQQGMCGSCWAVASATVLESHLALRTGKLFSLSPQELVSCVENPLHCGGSGGCTGATYELAFDYVVEHGVVLDAEFPYTSGTTGKDGQCSLDDASRASVHDSAKESFQSQDVLRGASQSRSVLPVDTTTTIDSDFVDGAVATIQGYVNFPTNNYTLLMNAVATLGPIGVTVAANGWGLYSGGVFSLKSHNTTDATDVNHAVVLEGYGVDQETQEPYWLVRNSWGSSWGEGGYIRLARLDPSTLPDADFDKDDCGTDTKPSDGAGCTKDKDGNDIVPEPIKVCGTSAILYDTFVPIGGRLLAQSNGAASDATGTSPVVEFRRRMYGIPEYG